MTTACIRIVFLLYIFSQLCMLYALPRRSTMTTAELYILLARDDVAQWLVILVFIILTPLSRPRFVGNGRHDR
ncbi:hypothetical protein BD414DRAFT_496375 [Trametes punicea]|nr:hypothetical protein BD414DRAFT_503547 [Trametes punicea]KAI8976728.1 hypothetical protein BD414DRAFT_496375 [Trametes punicea]